MRDAHDKEAATLKAQLAAEAAKHAEERARWEEDKAGLLADMGLIEAEATRLGHVDAALAQALEDIAALERTLAEQVRIALQTALLSPTFAC